MHITRVERGEFLYRNKKKVFPFLLSPRSTTKTISAKGSIHAATTKTLPAVANIHKSTTKTLSSVANVRVHTTKTISAKASILVPTGSGGRVTIIDRRNFLRPLFRGPKGTAWFAGNPKVATTKTIPAVGNIRKSTTQTISALGNIRVTRDQTLSGLASIRSTTLRTLSGVSSIQGTTLKTITGLANVQAETVKTISAKGNISLGTVRILSAVASVRKTTSQTIGGLASVRATTTRTITGTARIRIATGSGGRVTVIDRRNFLRPLFRGPKGVAWFSGNNPLVVKTIPAVGNIQKLATKMISATGFIQKPFTVKTIPAVANVRSPGTQTLAGVANIKNFTMATISAVGNIASPEKIKFIGAAANIQSTIVRTLPAVGNIVIDTGPPTAPASLTLTGTGPITLTWTASTDDVGVTGYIIQRTTCPGTSGWTTIATVSGSTLSYVDNPGPGCWAYRIIAEDAVGNMSSPSPVETVTGTLASTLQGINARAAISAPSIQTINAKGNIITGTVSLGVRATQANMMYGKFTKNDIRATQANMMYGKFPENEVRMTQVVLLVAVPYLGSFNYAFTGEAWGHD